MELLNFLQCHWLSAFFLQHDQGRSEEGLALCHFSGWACFMDMCQGASFVYLSCVGCSSIEFFAPLFQLFSHLCQIFCHCSFRMV